VDELGMYYFILTEGSILRDLGVTSLIPTRGSTIIELRGATIAYLHHWFDTWTEWN